ncbi:hypothetical protein TL16_g03846 [Triparma laevis f. inornata]|uniref:EF-hand domain-containing protein n=1 Tax=Triparma laevis f. inornata TaxID=1714386 RepID=A0A9W7A5X5_9STRA|nr:hypothetical protein TL16_g03846 [Triparma laevis f. inornata]
MPDLAGDLDAELKKALKGPTMGEKLMSTLRSILEPLGCYISIPPYQPDNQDWEITFGALGLDYRTINKFWKIFYKMNKTHDGEVSIIEFMNYFDLNRTPYVVKCFAYCDTVGGGEMDFLEFIVSVWNFCTLDARTLTNFTFDLYDLDDDGEIAYDEIEAMIKELYGIGWDTSSLAREALNELALLSEKYGGGIPLDAFIRMLLFPAFCIQRVIQEKCGGVEYWTDQANRPKDDAPKHGERKFDRRHVQSVLRTYKTGSAAAILTHTGDPNEGLREWMAKAKETPVIDYDAVKKEIESKRGAKLLTIAEWRRRVNPKQREEYRKQLIREARIKKEQDERLEKERLELERLAAEKVAADLLAAKSHIIAMLKGGEELDEMQQSFALEHDLYTVMILGANAAEEIAREEAMKEKENMIEMEKAREEMILKRMEELENGEGEEENNPEVEEEKKGGKDRAMVEAVGGREEPNMGSNGRPKVHRKGRRMAEEGRWVDRPPPGDPPPATVKKAEAPSQIFDRKGKPLKQKNRRSSRRSSKRGSRSTSRGTSKNTSRNTSPTHDILNNHRSCSPIQGGVVPIIEAGGSNEGSIVVEPVVVREPATGPKLTPAEKILINQSKERRDSRRASRSANIAESRRNSRTWSRRDSKVGITDTEDEPGADQSLLAFQKANNIVSLEPIIKKQHRKGSLDDRLMQKSASISMTEGLKAEAESLIQAQD